MIKATFLDEISHDIPHHNWGFDEWDKDFEHMKMIGIDTVVMIRCGYRKWITYPSKVLKESVNTHEPSVDLVGMFLELSEKHGMNFYFGLYDSGKHWTSGKCEKEMALNKEVIDEVWEKYGNSSAFKGWYISQEISRKNNSVIEMYASLGNYCKSVSGGLSVMISPYIDGVKNISQYTQETSKESGITLSQHKKEWREIFKGIQGAVDIVAFQDGHVEYDE